MTYEFNTRDFCFSHGKEPKGYGSWAFIIEGGDIRWAPTSTYADAKRWARNLAKSMAPTGYQGVVRIKVCS